MTDGNRKSPSEDVISVPAADTAHEELSKLAFSVAACLRNEDYEKLSAYVHPVYGLVFSPSATVTLNSARCFSVNRTAVIERDDTVYIWGVRSGSDEPIRLTPLAYFSAYVYDRDYYSAPILSFDIPARTGNALENTATVFPEAHFVDLCFPATESGGIDWSILRLVFEEYEGQLRLTALIHSTYTE